MLSTNPNATGSEGESVNRIGIVLVAFFSGQAIVWTTRNDEIDLETNQLIGQSGEPLGLLLGGAKLEKDVLPST